ncbi:MAG: ribonuclease T [Gammaproteobacteria bacterium]
MPVVVDVETGGFNANEHALLEIAAVITTMDGEGTLEPGPEICVKVLPSDNLIVEPSAIAFTGIDLEQHKADAIEEAEAIRRVHQLVRQALREVDCSRAILVGHNAFFDLGFLQAAIERNNIKRRPFHPFSCFDTATLGGLAYGQTVLARACAAARIPYNTESAHSALYDAQVTAQLFCHIINKWQDLGGWPSSKHND